MSDSSGHPNKTVQAFRDAFQAALEYCTPYWEQYTRLYEFWHNKKFDALDGTYSKIRIALGHAAVQDRAPKLHENVFSTPENVTLTANNPEAELRVKGAQAWLRDLLNNQIKIQHEIIPTIQNVLIGGTGYRMPAVTYVPKGNGEWEPRIYSKDIEFFHVLPAPGGGHVNPLDTHQHNAVPWVMVIDWWTEEKLEYLQKQGKLQNVDKMLSREPKGTYDEDTYRDTFATVGNLSYTAPGSLRVANRTINDNSKRRRIVHWFRRDKHIIVGEDTYLLYEGEPPLPNGYIPLVKYMICPDLNNWFGISYLEIQEDLLKAEIMNVNYRMDHLLGSMFPVTWVRKDIMDAGEYTDSDFTPRPYDVKIYPASMRNEDIRKAIWYDRRSEVPAHSFVEEDRFKAWIQKVAGAAETTNSMQNVVGNRTATGVTSILNELSGRPNMESTIFEYMGLREECLLLLALGDKHISDPVAIRKTDSKDGFPWQIVSPDDIAMDYTVWTHGTKYLADKNQTFQKLLAMYPYWNNKQTWNQYELDRQALEVSGVLPEPDKALPPPPVQSSVMPGDDLSALLGGERPGGMASQQDINQQAESTRNRTTVEPRTGEQRPAAFAV